MVCKKSDSEKRKMFYFRKWQNPNVSKFVLFLNVKNEQFTNWNLCQMKLCSIPSVMYSR